MSALKAYRPEIDGLRAVAVAGVVAYHGGVPGIAGGFLGVDIFFVISGYLITEILLRGEAAGGFSLAGFYERRVRRLAPALIAMLAVVLPASVILLLPHDLTGFGRSLMAVVTLCSNILFWQTQLDYFASAAESIPLLHTWSLGVEEQFYLLYPAALLFAVRRGRAVTFWATIVIALLSLAAGLYWGLSQSSTGFFLPSARAWELMLGALLAQNLLPFPKIRALGEATDAAGVLLLVYALGGNSPSQFLGTLAACIGTLLLLLEKPAGPTLAARVLGGKPAAGVGLISYSLYLWHWPLIVLGTYYVLIPKFIPVVRLAMALLAVPVAYLSWRFIEKPFRGPAGIWTRQRIFRTAAAAAAIFFAAGSALYLLRGLPQRFDHTTRALLEPCLHGARGCRYDAPVRRNGRHANVNLGAGRPVFALWGDSHAGMYAPAFERLAHIYGVAGAIYVIRCPPLTHVARAVIGFGPQARDTAQCSRSSEKVLRTLESLHLRAVFLSARWAHYVPPPSVAAGDPFGTALAAVVARLKKTGAQVYFIEDVPEVAMPVPATLAKAHILGITVDLEPGVAEYHRQQASVTAATAPLERQHRIVVLHPEPLLCGVLSCRVVNGDMPFYVDADHLSRAGADVVAPIFEPVFKALAAHKQAPAP